MDAEVRIERYADQGRCIAHIDGRVVFVRFALPGELVRITLDEPHDRDDRFWTGEVVEVLEASEDRVAPAWPLAGPLAMGGGVGGADLVHVSLAGQLRWKAITISEQLSRIGHIDAVVPVDRMEGDESLGGLHWRTRIEMIADDDGRPSMRRRGTHIRVPLTTMPLASRALLAVADHEQIWDGGFEPGSQIRLSVPEPHGDDGSDTDSVERRADGGDAQTLRSQVGDNYAVLVDGRVNAGSSRLMESVTIDGTRFEYVVDANGFWQMHRKAPAVLAGHVLDLARRELDGVQSACVWDLYSGSGLFALPLATLTAPRTRMLSIEGGRSAVANAKRNLRHLDLGDVDARCGDVSTMLTHVPAHLSQPDLVLLDPPRAGARGKVCRQIAESRARSVIYVACDPASLARDAATLVSLGYRLIDIHAFDIYPMTHHVETVALFRR
ncbi:class I SAM-dependent RNA methyltransferase [Bifidobacterium jacchi]|uniref:Class I SAM-dependent RNA methyltransferase n=1 Tax=Bifidobacterium jacchi TaxID=2490545 RepID=A0A5N5REZ9_9BIFI|nr:TRAM domain-containing protein [Bifidobacterium jacchi]KAB5605835.1 class I SAM-dependent RNA methyltransferase [Bifidobacterium jacchi]